MTKLDDVAKKDSNPVATLAAIIKREIKRKPIAVSELSSRFDRGIDQIRAALYHLEQSGFHVNVQDEKAEIVRDLPIGGEFRIDAKKIKGKRYRFGFTADNHLGSKYTRLDVLNAIYDRYEREGIEDVYQAGNILDGVCRFNRFDLLPGCNSMDGQVDYLVKEWPSRKKIVTRFIVGDDHEGWWTTNDGVNVGRYIEDAFTRAGRTDLHYLGYLEADVRLPAQKGETWIRVQHSGGGSTYALSYTSQKSVESLQGGEKPDVLLVGHYHKMDLCMPREVFVLQGGCTQDQTPFMRKKKIAAHVGAWICELEQANDGHVASLKTEFMRFYDRKFYQGEKYQRW